jgi:hypothetical protein
MISMVLSSDTSHLNRQFDGTVIERLFKHSVALLAGFELCFFDGIALEEAIQLFEIAPAVFVVVVGDLCRVDVADNGIPPVRQLHGPAGG